MGDIIFVSLATNAIIFSFLFWIITWACKYFYTEKKTLNKLNFFECGFSNINAISLNISIQFLLTCVFLILYDVEFLIAYPALGNLASLYSFQFFLLLSFFSWLLLSILLDYMFNAIEWSLF